MSTFLQFQRPLMSGFPMPQLVHPVRWHEKYWFDRALYGPRLAGMKSPLVRPEDASAKLSADMKFG